MDYNIINHLRQDILLGINEIKNDVNVAISFRNIPQNITRLISGGISSIFKITNSSW